MAKNVGSIDKIIRLVLGVALGGWAIPGPGLGSTLSFVALAVSAILILTGLLNFCPLFRLIGISSNKGQA